MDKSHIENKSQIEQAVKLAIRHVREWTRSELRTILSKPRVRTEIPIIIPLGPRGFLVGDYAMLQTGSVWNMIYRYNDQELEFVERDAAIFYAVCQQTNRLSMAEQLYKYDQNINRLNVKVEQFKTRLERASRNRNSNAKDLYVSRHSETVAQLKRNQFLLEKTLNLAKYFNC